MKGKPLLLRFYGSYELESSLPPAKIVLGFASIEISHRPTASHHTCAHARTHTHTHTHTLLCGSGCFPQVSARLVPMSLALSYAHLSPLSITPPHPGFLLHTRCGASTLTWGPSVPTTFLRPGTSDLYQGWFPSHSQAFHNFLAL